MKELAEELTPEEKTKINRTVMNWRRRFGYDLKRDVAYDTGFGVSHIKPQTKKSYGLVEMVGFRFPRYLVFVEMGVFGGFNRKESVERGFIQQPWFNPAVERRLPELMDLVGKELGPITVNAARVKIKHTDAGNGVEFD